MLKIYGKYLEKVIDKRSDVQIWIYRLTKKLILCEIYMKFILYCSCRWKWSPHIFQASSFQLLKLENLLRWSLCTFKLILCFPVTKNHWTENRLCTVLLHRSIKSTIFLSFGAIDTVVYSAIFIKNKTVSFSNVRHKNYISHNYFTYFTLFRERGWGICITCCTVCWPRASFLSVTWNCLVK